MSSEAPRKMRKIGLDLGAGKCCIAIADDGEVTVLADALGDRTTPSFVAFNNYRTLAGRDARDQANINPTNTAYGMKTIIGRTVGDPVVDRILNSHSSVTLPFPRWRAGEGEGPVFRFEYKNEELELRPEQITALLIGKMKSIAQKSLDGDINRAVISVPVHFNTVQRQATLDAARIAGFQNATLVNSTTAAAVAYWNNDRRKDDCIAIVDIGAGSANFAIISIKAGSVKVEEAYGDCRAGGNDVDLCIMSALVQKFNDQNSVEFQGTTKTLMRLRLASQKLKHKLSLLTTGSIQVEALCGEVDMSMTFTRREMVESCKEVLGVVRSGLSRLKDSQLWENVRCAVLVGGSTRIPAVKVMISSVLRIPLKHSLDKDEAVACGAALLGSSSHDVEDVLGRRIWYKSGTIDEVIFDCNNPVTDEKTYKLPLTCDMEVWETVMPLGKEKAEVFKLCSVSAFKEDQSAHEGALLFSVSESGIFRAERIISGKSIDIELQILSLRFSALSCCVEIHSKFLKEEKQLEENENAMNDLESFCYEQRKFAQGKPDWYQELVQLMDDALQWLKDNPNAAKYECDRKRRHISDRVRAFEQH